LHLLRADGFLNAVNEPSIAGKLVSRISQVDPFLLVGALDALDAYSMDETIMFLSYFVNQSRKITYSGADGSNAGHNIDMDKYRRCTQLWDEINSKMDMNYDPKNRNDKWVQLLNQMITCDKKYFELNLLYEEEFRYMLDKLVKICHELRREIAAIDSYPSLQHNCLQIIDKFRYATSS
jgi:hypothetical protein